MNKLMLTYSANFHLVSAIRNCFLLEKKMIAVKKYKKSAKIDIYEINWFDDITFTTRNIA